MLPTRKPAFDGHPFGSLRDESGFPRRDRVEASDWIAIELAIWEGAEISTLWAWSIPAPFLAPSSSHPLFFAPSRGELAKALGLKITGQLRAPLKDLEVDVELELHDRHLDGDEWASTARVVLTAYRTDIDLDAVPGWIDEGMRRLWPQIAPMAGPASPPPSLSNPEHAKIQWAWIRQAQAFGEAVQIEQSARSAPSSGRSPSL